VEIHGDALFDMWDWSDAAVVAGYTTMMMMMMMMEMHTCNCNMA